MQFNRVNDFLVHVQEELDNNRLILPTLPDIAIKVRSIVNKEGTSAKELADVIITDAVLSARIIQVPFIEGVQKLKTFN